MPRRDEGYFSSKDGTRLYWQSMAPDADPKAVIGIVHGYGDHSGRYEATTEAFVTRGFSVIAFDYRGHGKADGKRADVLKWEHYLDDMETFWSRVVEAAKGAPAFVVAHSHGALIATHWAARRPQHVTGLVFVSPFYALAFEPPALKLFAAKLIRGLAPGLQLGNELKPDQLSRDEKWQQATAADPLYLHVTTPRWFFEHQAAQRQLAGLGKDLQLPLLMAAGSDDPIASVPAARAFFETVAARDKTWKEYAGYRHEVLNEIGKEQVWADISQWISEHS